MGNPMGTGANGLRKKQRELVKTSNVINVVPFIRERQSQNKKIRDTFNFAVSNYNGMPSLKTLHVWGRDILAASSLQQPPMDKHNLTIDDLLMDFLIKK